MPQYMTTAQVARALGLADSTIRHYRVAGRIAPRVQTPGGHARYDLDEVVEALGAAGRPAVGEQEGRITGLVKESFAPLGRHDVRSSGRSGVLPAEMVALGTREVTEHEPARSAPDRPRWGGTLITARSRIHA